MVRVFAYQADPAGRSPEAIAKEAFAICNGHPATSAAMTCPTAIILRTRAAVAIIPRKSAVLQQVVLL
jgi:hypothetical protein